MVVLWNDIIVCLMSKSMMYPTCIELVACCCAIYGMLDLNYSKRDECRILMKNILTLDLEIASILVNLTSWIVFILPHNW